MATSSVVIAGATYSDVPSVTLKDTSNNDVSFVLTSDADATASDIRKNKIAYANGQKIVGDYELNLQEKTVTPTTSTQVVTANGDETTCINVDNVATTKVTSPTRKQYVSLTWDEPLVVGQTYHFYVIFDRRSYHYTNYFTYDGDLEFTGFPMTILLTSSTPTLNNSVYLDETELRYDAVSSDEDTNYMTLVVTKQGESYDGLSKVTVNPIPSDYVHVEGTLPITNNGTVDVSTYQYAEVNVGGGSQTQSKTATPTKSTQTITPDSGYLLSSVVVNPIPSEYIIPNLQSKSVTPTKSTQTISADSGYDGLSSISVNAIPSNYIDTTDATASASDIRSGSSAYVNGSKVNGSLVVNKVYVGSSDPSSSFGNDGDIYIKVV